MRRVLFFLLVCGFAGPALAQPAPDVHVPPIEIRTSLSFDIQRSGTADLPGGVGAVLGIDGNLNDHVAIATAVSNSPRTHALMAGPRLTTGFFTEGPGLPGRFFADVLAGRNYGGAAPPGPVIQVGAGADVIVVRRGVSLHWALDYLFMPRALRDFAGPRFSAGIVVGPRIIKPARHT